MFDFDLGEELELIASTARTFATEELFPNLREHERERSIQPSVRKIYSEMGLAGLELPESLGGAGLETANAGTASPPPASGSTSTPQPRQHASEQRSSKWK